MAAQRLHADQVDIDTDLVRRLLHAQFPAWADLPISPVESTGTDNAIHRLGEDLGLRLPKIHWAVGQIEKELEWLPRLAPALPVRLPLAVAVGAPDEGYPWPWLVYRWIDGDNAMVAPAFDPAELARELARFVLALRAVDPTGAPSTTGRRGGGLASFDEATRKAINELRRELDVARATAVWEEALNAPGWAGPPVWIHGDLLPGNVIVRDGHLSGVIDWSSAGVGDPAGDLMIAWSMLAEARDAYRAALDVDDASWARGRGAALSQAVVFIPYYERTIPEGVSAARRRLKAILGER
jgi:aminoglycoside phosphotransferase (APT) family kinase protein